MTIICKPVMCCEENPPLIFLVRNDNILYPSIRCCDDDLQINSVADINATLAEAICCRKSWCIKVKSWGNDGSYPVGTCDMPGGFLGETIKDYVRKTGCGSSEVPEAAAHPCDINQNNPTFIQGDQLFAFWTCDRFVGDIRDIDVEIDIYNDNSTLLPDVEYFDGASILFKIESEDGGGFLQAYKAYPFPFTIGELLGPHCNMRLITVGETSPQFKCAHGLVDIW